MLDGGPQLPYIPRPVVIEDAGHSFRRKLAKRFFIFLGGFLEKRPHKERQILLAIAERRHRERNDVQAEIEIVPELSLRYKCGKVPVCRRDQADIGMQRLVSAYPFEGAFAKHAKNLYLRVFVDFTDFVQKESPARRLFEAPDAALERLR